MGRFSERYGTGGLRWCAWRLGHSGCLLSLVDELCDATTTGVDARCGRARPVGSFVRAAVG